MRTLTMLLAAWMLTGCACFGTTPPSQIPASLRQRPEPVLSEPAGPMMGDLLTFTLDLQRQAGAFRDQINGLIDATTPGK